MGNRVGDTTTTFATIIGTYINQRYKDVLKRTNWNGIAPNYVVSATSAASTYALPSDFGKELYVYDTVNKIDIPATTIDILEGAYYDQLKDAGTVEAYCIYASADSTTRTTNIRLFRKPSTSIDFDVPYTLKPLDMSAASEIPCIDCERAIELGAASDAWMYKRQFAKAQAYDAMYEREIQILMWDKDNQPNLTHRMQPQALDRDMGI